MAPITVTPNPLYLFSGYLMGSSSGVKVFLLRNHRLKDASSKYTKGFPETIILASWTAKVSRAATVAASDSL